METTYRVVVFEPGRRFLTESITGPVPGEMGAAFEAVDGGTRVTFHADLRLSGPFKLAGLLAARQLKAETEGNFQALKALLEG